MDSLISTFHIDWHMMVAQVINFAIVFFVLYRFAIKPLQKMLDERTHTIKQGLTDAEENAKVLKDTQTMFDAEIARARQEGFALISEAKKRAETEHTAIMEKAKLESDALVAQTKKQLESEKEKMLRDAERELATVVISATAKVLEGSVSAKVDEELVKHSLAHHD